MSSFQFSRDMDNFMRLVQARYDALFAYCSEHVGRSIRFGSATTGAPGQPVKTGLLLGSWVPESAHYNVRWATPVPYAQIIEDNLRGAQLRSKVGGFHSVKMTYIGWHAIVAQELARVKAAMPDGAAWRQDTNKQWHDTKGRWSKAPG